ncbi:MAG: hypothetical protein Kow0062_09500 [Acidobacteriota bacterium]
MVGRGLAAVLLLGAAAIAPAAAGEPDRAGTALGEVASIDGRPVLPAPQGTVTELLFVARWCGPCAEELERSRHRAATLRRRGFRLVPVGVAARQDAAEFAAWAREHGAGGPLVYDGQGRLERELGVDQLPYHVVVDATGRVLYRGPSAPAPERLARWLAGSDDR